MRKKFYRVFLLDHTSPSFISSFNTYYGTIDDIQTLIDGTSDEFKRELQEPFQKLKEGKYVKYNAGFIKTEFANSVSIVAQKEIACAAFHFSFTNTWGFPYEIDCDGLIGKLVVLRATKNYICCYKVKVKNARMVENIDGKRLVPMMLGDMIWGFPNMIKHEVIDGAHYLTNTLYMRESEFETKEEALARFNSDKPLYLQLFFWDIFGDG